ncbi:HypC/HybG/HupF family hydrogenase formation chaperone [uncultured Enorma sp.]|uniref:HypC/HybG/HupF family hydrogenase formation chaperone n=1 Tax=uncultured Enorma sp. TaxID=1714346 RepID=UPI0028057F62|nr:HypC/HybG/HupF family hydrogenase formation chaperone [uncultured Enorma sp.]
MCLAIPGQVVDVRDGAATIDMMGVRRDISLSLTPSARIGDWVLVHAGFAIEVIDAKQAEETIQIVRELDKLASEDLGLSASTYQTVPSQAAHS